ncbi:hypothetical protein MASR2M29_21200 [Spirochaetota bacterium]
MTDDQIFERNMLAIASCHGPVYSDKIRSASASEHVHFELSKSGKAVPYMMQNGKKLFYHSRFDPEREAIKLAQTYSKEGFFVFLGLGAGYLIDAFLKSNKIVKGIIVEYGSSELKAILKFMDLSHILGDRRLKLLLDPEDDDFYKALASNYVPVLGGDFFTVPLINRTDLRADVFSRAVKSIRNAIALISDDYSVQSFFGKRWFSNIIRNLKLSALPTPPIATINEAYISAAGPSLELAMQELADRPKNTFLIATDTSLRALLENGIEPDAVISIDCQHISYYHFSLGLPPSIPLFLDLASPPTVARLAKMPYFFSSGHPLSRYLASKLRPFPIVDTSGGNVTHAAVSLANYLGAKRIKIFGADYSYPYGKSYARGTYIYPYFYIRQGRLKPAEALFSDFLYRNQLIEREEEKDGLFRYITKPLVAYKERFELLDEQLPAQLLREQGMGVITRMPLTNKAERKDAGKVFASGRPFMSPEDFLADYKADIASLAEPQGQAQAYLDALSAHDKDLWTTMLPAAAAFRRESGQHPPGPSELLAETRVWCMLVIGDELNNYSNHPLL